MIKSQTSYEAALNRGHSYNWDQDWEAAIRAFQQAIKEVPHEPMKLGADVPAATQAAR